jgi:uncharacterized protein YigE (DUF2233 family)
MGNLLAGQLTQPSKIITSFHFITQGATLNCNNLIFLYGGISQLNDIGVMGNIAYKI